MMLSGNSVKTLRRSYDELHEPLRLTMLSGNWAQLSGGCVTALSDPSSPLPPLVRSVRDGRETV